MLRSLIVIRNSRLNISSHGNPWAQLCLKELRAECKNRGLKVSGKKVDLVRRLNNQNRNKDDHIQETKHSRNKSKKSKSIGVKKQVRSKDSEPKLDVNPSPNKTIPKESDTIPTTITTTTVNDINVENEPISHVQQPPVENESVPHVKESLIENQPDQHIQQSPVENEPAVHVEKSPIEETPIENEPVAHAQESPVDIGTVKSSSNEMENHITPTRRTDTRETSSDPDIYSSESLSVRDKFFLISSTACTTIWWCLPHMPNFTDQILKSYKYLQSFF